MNSGNALFHGFHPSSLRYTYDLERGSLESLKFPAFRVEARPCPGTGAAGIGLGICPK